MKQTLVFILVAILSISAIESGPQKRDVSAVSTTSSSLDFTEVMNEISNAFKHMAPCGDASMGYPVLAPLRIPIVTLNINHELLILNGSIKNMVLTGLDDFITIDLSSAPKNRTTFDIIYKDLQLLGDFNLYVNANLGGYKIDLSLIGLLNLQALDVRFYGGITLGTNAVGGVQFSDVVYDVDVGDILSHTLETQWSVALNTYVNKYIRDTAMVWLQSNRELVNEMLSNFIAKTVNRDLYNVTLSTYLEGVINIAQEWNALTCTV